MDEILTEEEQNLVRRLRQAQTDQGGPDRPLLQQNNVEDLLWGLKATVGKNPNFYNGIYFTDDGRAYVVGIIDSLTDWNFKKKAEKNVKMLINHSTTPEGYWSASCLPP